MPGYCEVNATVGPQTDITVRMPDTWYLRYLQLGGGGFDGSIPNLAAPPMNFNKNPIAHGFAVAGSNGGHRASAYPGASFAVDRGLSLSYASGKIQDTDTVGTSRDRHVLRQARKVPILRGLFQRRQERFSGCGRLR